MKCNTILKPVTRMVFQCTWRTCGHYSDVREQMEEHVRIKHLGITSCTDDHEEDFYYTEVELDSPLDSSGISSADQSPMHEPSNNSNNINNNILSTLNATNSTIDKHRNLYSPVPVIRQAARKRGPKPRTKHLIESSVDHFTNSKINSAIATWMHMDMSKPPTEDPEYKLRLNSINNKKTNSIDNQITTAIKRERKRAASNNQYNVTDQSDLESTLNQHYLRNLTAEQLTQLQQQNNLHLKNNIQHLQQLHRQHQHLQQLNQYNQQVKRKYVKSQQSGNSSSMLIPTRTKSVICSMAQLENELDHHHLLNSASLSPNPLKRSKPIKIPGISLAHRDAVYQNANQSPSFTVGSVQLSPTGYFHCFSPTPPHSLSSPTSSNSSMYSLGSCNSPSSSIASSSSSSYSPNGVQSLNRSSSHYSPIDTLLQTVENERLQQQLAMEDCGESSQSTISNSCSSGKRITKLKSANVSDLDLIAQNEDEDLFVDHQQKQTTKLLNKSKQTIDDKSELDNQTSSETTIKCTNNSQLIMNNSINKKTLSSVIRNGHEALLVEGLTVDCSEIDHQKKLNNTTATSSASNTSSLIDLQTKQQQLVQTAQQALVTLASTATNLCSSIQSKNAATSQNFEKSNSIQNNSTNNSQIIQKVSNKSNRNGAKSVVNQQNDGLLMAANLLQSVAEKSSHQQQQPFNYLVSQSGRTIKPTAKTAAAKSYVQRKNRIAKYMRTQNSSNSSNSTGKQSGLNNNKSKNSNANNNNNNSSNLIDFERFIEAESQINNQNDNHSASVNLNIVRNSIISSVVNLNYNNNSNANHIFNNSEATSETQQSSQIFSTPTVQRTPTGRIRNSGAKCRKKYGMENKHQWCVQCRWKKACSRVDSNSGLNLIQYNNNNQAGETRNRPGRPANSSNNNNNNSDQRRAVAQATSTSTTEQNNNQHNNTENATSDSFSVAMAEELQLLRTGTLLNNQRTVVSAN